MWKNEYSNGSDDGLDVPAPTVGAVGEETRVDCNSTVESRTDAGAWTKSPVPADAPLVSFTTLILSLFQTPWCCSESGFFFLGSVGNVLSFLPWYFFTAVDVSKELVSDDD